MIPVIDGLFLHQDVNGKTIIMSTRRAGNMSLRFSGDVQANRSRLMDNFGLRRRNIVYMAAEMGGRVFSVTSEHGGHGSLAHDDGIPCDAMFTAEEGVFPTLLPADCAPIFVVHRDIWGIIHAGRPNAHVIIENSLNWLVQQGVKLGTVTAVLGPTIRPHTYFFPVGKEQYISEQLQDKTWGSFISLEPQATSGLRQLEGFRIDLPGYVRSLLLTGGILPEHFFDLTYDTADGFFSNALKERRGIDGRHACLIGYF